MGFLARRTPAAVPADRPAPTAPTPPASPVPAGPTARIEWRRDEPVGWDRVPAAARAALARAGYTGTDVQGEALVAGVWAPVTRRDPGGRYWLDTDAWWIDTATLLTIRAREALTPHGATGDGRRARLRRAGGGRVQVTTHPLTGAAPTGQRWSRPQPPPGGGSSGADSGVRIAAQVVDVLPRAVQVELGPPTGQLAIRHYPAHGGYHDHVGAYRRLSPTELIAVAAVREAGAYPDPDTAIEAADWHITTYRPRIGPPTQRVLDM